MKDSIVFLKKKPFTNCYIFKFKDKISIFKDPSNSISIFSKDSNLVSLSNGYVKNITSVDNTYYVSINKEKNDTTYIYGNIEKLYVNKGFLIKEGDVIGKIMKDKFLENQYALLLSLVYIVRGDFKFLNYIDIYEYLLKNYD